jgi:hypothetical protein
VFHQSPGDFKAGEAGHLHVEKGDVRPTAGNFIKRFDTVSRFADDVDAVELAKQETQLVSRVLLIVGNDGRQCRGGQAVILSAARLSGISTRATAPLPGRPVSVKRPSAP